MARQDDKQRERDRSPTTADPPQPTEGEPCSEDTAPEHDELGAAAEGLPAADGARAPAERPTSGAPAPETHRALSTHSPLDGKELTPVVATGIDELADRLQAARRAQTSWAARSLPDRIDTIARVKQRLLAEADAIGAIVRAETAKPLEEALLAEVLPSADVVDYWCDSIEELLDGTPVELSAVAYPGKQGRIHRDPRGLVALITPWNFPVAIPLRTIVPALLAGNALVWKPSELTPRAAALVASLFDGLLPEGLLTVVQGGAPLGAALVAADVDLVVFTGSVPTGRAVARACAERFVPCSLELGGKDAAIVLEDCRLERTARGIVWGAFNNAGQNCAAIERVYVVAAIADRFIERVVALTRALRLGTDVSGLTSAAQRAVVLRHLADAVRAGAEVLTGGSPDDEDEPIPPTVLRLETDDALVLTDETFGPLLPIRVVADVDEAIARTNACRYALTASVWTRRVAYGHELAKRLRPGIVTVNNHGFTAALPAAPWTGIADTGGGITGSSHALGSLTRVRFVLEDRNRAKSEVWWYPYTPVLRAVALAMAAVRGGVGWVGRIVALLRLLVLLPKRLRGG